MQVILLIQVIKILIIFLIQFSPYFMTLYIYTDATLYKIFTLNKVY